MKLNRIILHRVRCVVEVSWLLVMSGHLRNGGEVNLLLISIFKTFTMMRGSTGIFWQLYENVRPWFYFSSIINVILTSCDILTEVFLFAEKTENTSR